MTQKQIDGLGIKARAKQQTPPFFEKVRNISLAVAAAGTAIVAAQNVLSTGVVSIGEYMIVAGTVAASVSQVTVKS